MNAPTGLQHCETFVSVQGEGPNVGKPSLFVRLGICNFTCHWCDTLYSWHPDHMEYEIVDEDLLLSLIDQKLREFPKIKHLVLTGGEPLVHGLKLLGILRTAERSGCNVEVETNASIIPPPVIDELVTWYDTSPKLSNAAMERSAYYRPASMRWFINSPKATFKFVIESQKCIDEMLTDYVEALGVPPSRILLMPQGKSVEEIDSRMPILVGACLKYGFRISDRLQIRYFGDRRGT